MELSAAITAWDWICFIQHKAPDALYQPGRLFWIITDRAGDRRLQTPLLWVSGLYGVSPGILGMVWGDLGCLSGQGCPKHQEQQAG